MKILSVNTSSKICSVAILEDKDLIIQKNINDEKTHSQKLMPIIDSLLKDCNLKLKDINLFACCIGPGSFTGVRIGVSTIKAFCDVTNIPVTGVNSLEGLAYNTYNSNFSNIDIICSLIDAKNDNVYCGLFKYENGIYSQLGNLYAKSIYDILNILDKFSSNHILFVGDGSIVHKYTILQKFSNATFVENKLNDECAYSIGKCGYDKYLKGLYGNSNFISPLYLKKSQAERALEGEK